MKKFIYRLSSFVILFLIMAYPLDILISIALKNTSGCMGEFEVWNDIYNKKINCEVAIYGSSRALVHINPGIVEKTLGLSAYNFGINGHNFFLQHLRHKEFFKNNAHPKVIIHSIDMFTLDKKAELYNMDQFLPYMLWNTDIYEYTSTYEGFSKAEYRIPLLRYFNKAAGIEIFTQNYLVSKPLRRNGFHGNDRTWNNDLDEAIRNRESYNSSVDSASLKLYEMFLKECISENIQIVMVYTPEYIEGQKFVANRDDIMNIFHSIAHKYDLPFLDYSKHSLSYNKIYFYNASHLNAKGADIFTKILCDDLSTCLKIQ